MSARFLSVPTVDWLAPIDHSAIARARRAEARARRRRSPRPARRSASGARSGVHSARGRQRLLGALGVALDERAVDQALARRARASIALSSGRSAPGRTGRCRSASSAVGVRRGSTTITCAPSAWRRRIRDQTIGWQAAVLEPEEQQVVGLVDVGVATAAGRRSRARRV